MTRPSAHPKAAAPSPAVVSPPPVSTSLEAKVVVLGSQNVGKTSLVHRYVHSSFLPGHMTPSTVGASFLTTRVHDPETDTTMRLQIWDTAGQERFRSISKLYYRGAHAAVLCYDITSQKSFEDMGVWLRELKEKGTGNTAGDDATILHIVGTKSDIVAEDPSKREVPFERCIDFVAQELFPTSPGPPAGRPGSSHALKSSPPSITGNLNAAAAVLSPHSNRSSVLWGAPDQVWDCCHEISAKDGEGIDEVFRVITRKLIEQHHVRLERQRLLDASLHPADHPGYFGTRHHGGYGHQTPSGYLTPALATGPGSSGGSFRLGHGDKRRSWLGLVSSGGPASMTTTPGFSGLSPEEEERMRMLESRQGKCC